MERLRTAWASWALVALLTLLCAFLALLQNRWIDELAQAEKSRLRQELQVELNQLSSEFNAHISSVLAGLLPSTSEVDKLGREKAYSEKYLNWRESHDEIFSYIAIAVPEQGSMSLYQLDLNTGHFAHASWPARWQDVREALSSRLKGEAFGPVQATDPLLIEVPRFGPSASAAPGIQRAVEQDWLLVELNAAQLGRTVLPEFLEKHFGGPGKPGYRAEIVSASDPHHVIFRFGQGWDKTATQTPDASARLLQIDFSIFHARPDARAAKRVTYPSPPPEGGQGRWQLMVQHEAGSLETIVSRARRQNILISLGILLLILAAAVTLVRFSRRAQYLAELQMNFVAGVSHELRTPLTVIRTAAFNLQGRLATKPEQVERYGALIQQESEKLGDLVEQVLQFAGLRAGHIIREREPVAIESIVEEGIRTSRVAVAGNQLTFEKRFDPHLPLVLADKVAMKHVVRNLVDNALKYGTEGNNWIGVFTSAVDGHSGRVIEIRVADRGPGIPTEEQPHIFEPFFRGRRAIQDQVHGTGLGLNIVKKIVEAHGGTIQFKSESMKGTEFVIRIPTTLEAQDEFAHSLG